MKRLLGVVIVIAFLMGIFCYADGYKTTEVQIKMLEIDYNDTFLDSQVKLDSTQGFSGGYWALGEDISMGMTVSVEDIVTSNSGLVAMFEDGMSTSYYYTQYNSEAQIAGYNLGQITLYFAYGILSDCTIDSNVNNGKFYAGIYTFYPEDVNAMYEDLFRKLCSVYGDDCGLSTECIYQKFTNEITLWSSNPSQKNCALWDSSTNDMWLLLQSVDYQSSDSYYDDCVQIIYIWRDADTYIARLKDIMRSERKASEATLYGNNNTSGL